jgi:hypothetical protein
MDLYDHFEAYGYKIEIFKTTDDTGKTEFVLREYIREELIRECSSQTLDFSLPHPKVNQPDILESKLV